MSGTTTRRHPGVTVASLPAELIERSQWIAWRWEQRGDKRTKIPVSPATGAAADTTDPATWAPFDVALDYARRTGYGLGYVFSADDPFAGVDLDGCRDPRTGAIEAWASAIVAAFGTYTEVTPSGAGLHLIGRGRIPGDRRRSGRIEMYDAARFFTMTGATLAGHDRPGAVQDALNALYRETFPAPVPSAPRPASTLVLDDRELIERARRAANGARFDRLMAGDTSDHGGDESAADLALCSMLAFWTQDAEQIARIVATSGRARPKWERADYRRRTIDKALARSAYYEPPQPAPRSTPQASPLRSEPTPAADSAPAAGLDSSACQAERARIAELERQVAALTAERDAALAEVAQLRRQLEGAARHQSVAERIHNNPGLTPAQAQIAENVVNEVAAKVSTGQDDDGWALVRMDAIVKTHETVDPETGEISAKRIVSKQQASRYIATLADAGVWEVQDRRRHDGQSPITDKYIRLTAPAPEVRERLATIVLERPQRGGSKPGHRRCGKHPDAGVDISTLTRCAECGEILDEQHVKHVPAARFHHGTEDQNAPRVDDSPMGVQMEPSPATAPQRRSGDARIHIGTVTERRRALRDVPPARSRPSVPPEPDWLAAAPLFATGADD